jgi:hypothetical protein
MVKEFVKHVYRLPNTLTPTLVHYMGNDQLFKARPHGNNKKNHNNYQKTKPSNMAALNEMTKSQNASSVYKNNQTKVRNLKQAQNAKYTNNKSKKIKYDPMYNLFLLHKEHGCVKVIIQAPELIVIATDSQLIDEVNKFMKVYNDGSIFFSYDTTFKCGDFYVSPLQSKHFVNFKIFVNIVYLEFIYIYLY